MLPRLPNIYTLLYLSLCFNVVVAGLLGPYPRQDTSATTEATKTTQDGDKGTTTAPPDASKSSDSPSITSSIEVTTTATSEPAITAIPSAINGNNPSNDSYSETPAIVEGELPLQPRLTPGWGVAGAIMLISGVIYTLIGIKNEWLHTFFSSAYLASLCVTVLIVYVMNPPVSDAIQGAYVVAGVCTGIILGGAATAFRELTEGLGCLLGGFCLAMWLLTLHEGGLLPSTTGKVIFIVAFTLAGFASYFSRYTRPYALIGLMSFAGATVTVLGIDCFSRAGLKEFWVYIWNLNDKLFPLEATTFPLTKGIRVEIAVTIVLTILGLISQLKLWRVIQEHRVKRAEERAEFQRMRDEEEADVGRRVEQDNDRERRQWETTYGDPPMSPTASRDSGVGEMENEKKGRLSQTTVQPVSPSETEAENAIEMADLSASGDTTSSEVAKQVDDGVVIANPDEDHGVTIRVSRDEGPDGVDASSPIPEPDEKAWMAGVDKARPASAVLPRSSQRYSNVTGPDVVPLPFRVPELHEGVNDDDRSSFATFADEDERSITLSKRASRASLSHRLSVGSGNLLRSLSQRSQKPKRQTGEFESPQPSPRPRGSHEELTLQDRRPQEDNRSVAATIDGMSGDEDDFEQPEGESRWTMEIKAELADRLPNGEFHAEDKKPTEPKLDDSEAHLNATRPYSTTETIATGILNPSLAEEIIGSKSKRSSATNATGKMAGISEADNSANAPETKAASETSRAGKSVSPSAASSASLTKERLPSSLSRVALSYRTNEWAKHLSHAEKPDPEELQLNEYPAQDGHSKQPEIPAPIDVEELQRTPEDGIPATSIVRSPSTMSNAQSAVPVYRSLSTASAANSVQAMPPLMSTAGQVQDSNDKSNFVKHTQPHTLHTGHNMRIKSRRQSGDVIIQPILEERGDENSIRANIPQEADEPALKPNPPSPTESEPQGAYRTSVPGLVSYNSPQTLIGQRDMFLRSKSQSTLLLTTPIPEGQQYVPRSVSQMDFSYNHPTHSPFVGQDADDIPLSQRKELMRQSSMLSVKPAHGNPRPNSTMRMASTPIPSPAPVSPIAAEASQFDSHQPQRRSTLPSQVHREAQLANFRQSVAAELRAGTPVSPPANNGRETPFLSASSGGLLGGMGPRNGIHEVEHNIDQQRNALLSQREQEAQRKQLERQEKEQNERTFEELMRRGDLMDAHREAMRRMQGAVKDR